MPPPKKLITVDIGNTTTDFGLFIGKRLVRSGKTLTRAEKNYTFYYREMKKIIGASNLPGIEGMAVSSVVPAIDGLFRKIGKIHFGLNPFFVNHRNCGLKIKYDKPAHVGADRLSNAAAGILFYGTPLIVIDFGTAITFDCINKKGEYEGGIILPGAELTATALHEHTAKLPIVNPFTKPASLIGKNTKTAILSGIYYGTEGGINLILGKLKTAMQCDRIVLTGGHAGFFKNRIKGKPKLAPGLTHTGIRIIWERATTMNATPRYAALEQAPSETVRLRRERRTGQP